MKKVRLRQSCPYTNLNTSYGVITHNWRDVPDDSYIYAGIEVFGETPVPKSEPIKEQLVVEVKEEPKKEEVKVKPRGRSKKK